MFSKTTENWWDDERCHICCKEPKWRLDEKVLIYAAMPGNTYALHREDNETSIFYCKACYLKYYENIKGEE